MALAVLQKFQKKSEQKAAGLFVAGIGRELSRSKERRKEELLGGKTWTDFGGNDERRFVKFFVPNLDSRRPRRRREEKCANLSPVGFSATFREFIELWKHFLAYY